MSNLGQHIAETVRRKGKASTHYEIAQALLEAAELLNVTPVGQTPWRVGTKINRNIYDVNDMPIGYMDSGLLAAKVVKAVNKWDTQFHHPAAR